MKLAALFSRPRQCLRHIGTLACAAFILLASPGADAAYVQVYSTIQKGAVTFTGNTLALQSTVTSGQGGVFIAAGSASQVAGYPVGTTTAFASNKSGAVLNVPIGVTVLYAELIWSGTIGALTLATYDNAVVGFTSPSGSVYPITPSAATKATSGTYYTRSANVTGLVQLGGSGTYFVGGVPAQIGSAGSTDAAGWTLAVAYSDPSQVARNLTLFVGAEQAGAPPASVSGFCTPVAGPVNGRLAVSGIEGDVTGTGDTMLFGPTSTLTSAHRVYGPNNPANGFLGRTIDNFFASQINGDTGTLNTSGTFGGSNQTVNATGSGTNVSGSRQGYDITNVDASARLINSQTTAFAQGTTTGDNYAVNALGMQINVTSPIFPVTVKSANKTFTFVGDTLRYSVNLDNTAGNGAANNVTFFDAIPPGMVLVSNSVTINGVAQAGANPATGVPIGNVAVGAVVTVAFDVTVVSLPASPAPAKFDNSARWTYTYIACGGVVAQAGEVTTNPPVSTPAARLEPVKTVSPPGQLVGGQTATYTLSVPNSGLLDTAGSTLADPIPVGTIYVAGSTKLNGVGVADGPGGTMPYATAALINSAGRPAGVIAFGATATVQFSVAATGGGTVNNVATIDPDGAGPGTALTVSAVNSGFAGPSVVKAFLPSTIGAGGKSTLTVTLTNPNAAVITGVSVTDNLPGGMVIANPANVATSCPGGTAVATPSGATLALSGASVPASGSCTFSADVTVATAGTFTNTIPANAVSSSNAGVSTAGSQTLTVTAAPSVSKSFVPSTVAANAVSTLTITLSNPTATALTSAGFSDIFPTTAAGAPGNMTLFDTTVTNTCGGTLTTSAGAALSVGSDSVKLTGGTIPATNVCTITVRVKAPTGGAYGNVIPSGALTTSGGANTALAQATLQIASPQVDKTVGPAPGVKELTVAANTLTILRITLTNVTGATITALAFTDTYPPGLVNTNTTTTNTCGGTATASATATNPGTLVLSGATTLAAGASCEITANVQSATSGSYTNTIAAGGVTSSIGPNATGTSATLNVARPNITKAFSVATVPLNSAATLTITLSNPTATAMTGAAFTDTLPAGLTAATPSGICVGTKAASGSTVSISGGTIPANGSCTVTAVVTGTTVGLKINTIPAGGLTVTGPAAGSSGTAATDAITVLAAPTISKSFLTSPILPITGVSTLQIVLANSNSVAFTGATFTDTFPLSPGAMTVANVTTTNSCSGTLNNNLGTALAVNSAGIQLTGGVIPANGSCTITVNVKASLAGDYLNTIAVGSLSTTNGGASTVAATAPLSVRLAAPTVAKSFSPSTIVANTATTMTLTITNPSTAQAITGAAWSDIFPAGMKVFSPPNFTNSCGGTVSAGNVANDTSIALSGATVPFNAGGTGSCSISVAVTSTVVAETPGMTNTTGNVTSANANASGTASANLIVNAPPLTAASIVKSFLQPTIGVGGVSTIRFALGSSNVVIVNNANFTDTLTNMSVASTTLGGTCVGVTNIPALVVGATGLNALNLTVPSLPPGGCTVEVQVTSSTPGSNPNSVSGVTTTQIAAGAGAGPVNLTVLSQVTVLKAFTPAAVSTNAASVLKITLTNPNALAITGAAFTDTYPGGLVNTGTPAGAINGAGCSGTVTAAAGGASLALGTGNVPAGGSSDITVNVTSAAVGSYVNNSGTVTTANAGTGASAGATLTVTGVAPPPAPQVTKVFTPNSIGTNGSTVLKITLVNLNAFALTSVAFTDNYPAALVNTASPGGAISGSAGCAGAVAAAANGSSLALSGGNLPANGTCDISVNVTSASAGTYLNSSGPVTSAEAPAGTAGSGTLTVLGRLTVLKSFTPTSVAVNAASVLKITLTNPNAVAVTGAAFTDAYPGGLVNTGSPNGAIGGAGCSGTITAAAGGASLDLGGATVPAGGSCDITVNVTSAAAGSYLNNSGAVTTANAGSGASSGATLTVTAALQVPGVSKTFTPSVILTGDSSLLRVTITNPNAVPITSAAFTDNYPATLSNTGTAAFNAASALAGCTGTITGSAGTSSLALTNGNIPAGVSCVIEVNVTSNSAVPVLLTNPAFSVSTDNTPSGNAAAANLQVLVRPTIAKSFTPNTVLVGASSTLSLVITNPNPIPLSALAFTDTFPAGLAVAGAPNAVNGCGGTLSASAGATSIALSGGSLAMNQSCTLSVDVSSGAAGAYSNTSGGVSSFETGVAGAPSNTAVLTVNAPGGVQLSGIVYSDLNHNLQRDSGEAGTGLVLYAKLVATSSPVGPTLQAVLVNSATGAYQFSSVSPGDYFIVIDDNATLADVTPTIPAGWLGTEMPSSVRVNLLVGATDLQNLNFGLFNGSTVSGSVFADTGIVGGIANNGIRDGGESGIAGVPVKVSSSATTYDSTMTDGSGNYTLWIPAAATSPVVIAETNLGGYLSTGGGAGTTAGTYTRTSDSTGFTFAAGLSYVNVNFADVPVNRLIANGQQTGSPGNALFYPHQFNAGTGGTVSVSVVSASGWPVALYRDNNCNGVIDAGENVISATILLVAAEQICLINKVTIPAGTALGAQDAATLQASFAYTNATPGLVASLSVIDSTTVGVGSAGLVLTKTADKATALPGDTITYTVAYQNNGDTPIGTIVISDATPAFTTFVSAGCSLPLPAALTACSVSTQPAVGGQGGLQWTLTGSLNPASTGQVVFAVKVN